MPELRAPDGTLLAFHEIGDGPPLVCLPGGAVASSYLGDLGGLSAHRRLVLLDFRGTGDSAAPEDVSSYRCDRLVADVEALRLHLGLERMDLLAHSGAANVSLQYAAQHADSIGRLALVTPGCRAVGIEVTGEMRRATASLRSGEPWFADAYAALTDITAGTGDNWDAINPFFYGRWDEAAQAHHAAGQPSNQEAAAGFGAEGAFDPDATRAALTTFTPPVLLLAGEVDLNSPPAAVSQLAELFAHGNLAVQPSAGHYPWLDDPQAFVATVGAFLA